MDRDDSDRFEHQDFSIDIYQERNFLVFLTLELKLESMIIDVNIDVDIARYLIINNSYNLCFCLWK